MNVKLLKISLVWGMLLWLFGYIFGIVIFPFVHQSYIGWVIMPFGILVTLWVLNKKIKLKNLKEYFILGTVWLLFAVIADYLFLVKLFNPADGYYKPDVYIYYLITLLLPSLSGLRRLRKR